MTADTIVFEAFGDDESLVALPDLLLPPYGNNWIPAYAVVVVWSGDADEVEAIRILTDWLRQRFETIVKLRARAKIEAGRNPTTA